MISIVICTYNRCISLRGVLDALLNQANEGIIEYEVLVVDNNSNDGTKKVVEEYMGRFCGKLRYLFESRQGKSYALNSGTEESRGDIIVFTDDDVLPAEDWLSSIDKVAKEDKWDAIGGRILPLYQNRVPDWIKVNQDILGGPLVTYDYGAEMKPFNPDKMLPFVGANLIIRKECFLKNGPFRVDLGLPNALAEDTEYFRRLENSGVRLFYAGNILVWHKTEGSRTNLFYIARWFMKSGGFYAARLKEEEIAFRFFSVPRFLIRQFVRDLLSVVFSIFNRRDFLKNWMDLFRTIGMISYFRNRHA